MNAIHWSAAVPGYDGDGTVIVPSQALPLPQTLSPQAATWLSDLYHRWKKASPDPAAERGSYVATVKDQFLECQQALLESRRVRVLSDVIGGMDVDKVVPETDGSTQDYNRIALHFTDEQSLMGLRLLTSAICIASELGVPVVVPRCSIPAHRPRMERLEALLKVHEQLLRTHPAENIGWTGENRGAETCASLVVLAYQSGIPVPGAMAWFAITGLEGEWSQQNKYLDATHLEAIGNGAVPGHQGADGDPYDSVLYPINANMQIFPPCLLLAGTRDTNFDASVIFHREMKRAGCMARLHVFDGLPQSFHLRSTLPESVEAFAQLTRFFDSTLGGTSAARTTSEQDVEGSKTHASDSATLLLPSREVRNSKHISRDAQAYLHSSFVHYTSQFSASASSRTAAEILQDIQSRLGKVAAIRNELAAGEFQLEVEECYAGQTKVDVIRPSSKSGRNRHRALIYFCGGVYLLGNEQLYVALQIATLLDINVYLPRYRAFPEHSLADQDQDTRNAYEFVRQSHAPGSIGVFGESSGAAVTAHLIDLCRIDGVPFPGALALLGIVGSRGDSVRLNRYLDPMAIQNNIVKACVLAVKETSEPEQLSAEEIAYMTGFNPQNFPPTQLVTGTRDQLLSSTASFHRRLVAAGADAELNVYEGMPHAHHAISHLPEAAEALQELADFFDRKLQ